MALATLTARVHTGTIGNELVRLIKASVVEPILTAKTIDLGEPLRLAAIDRYADLLPAILIKPETSSYSGENVSNGTEYLVSEAFRICFCFSTESVSLDVWSLAIEALDQVGLALSQDYHLSAIAVPMVPHQIQGSNPDGVEWEPLEDLFLKENGIAVKVVVLRWIVTWIARRCGVQGGTGEQVDELAEPAQLPPTLPLSPEQIQEQAQQQEQEDIFAEPCEGEDDDGGGGGDPLSTSIWMNLGTQVYYGPDCAFVDVFKVSDRFRASAGTLALRSDGYPALLLAGQTAWTLTMREIKGHYPAGLYRCLWDGDGTVAFAGDAVSGIFDGVNGSFPVQVNPGDGGIILTLQRTNPANPIRNIRIVLPGFELDYATKPFRPEFLNLVKPFRTVRFMDWGKTNNSKVTTWAQRQTLGYQTQDGEVFDGSVVPGMAYEYIVEFCRKILCHPWICIPHLADDDYVRQLATLLRDTLDPRLVPHIEYTNEAWNPGFTQHRWCSDEGKRLGFSTDDTIAAHRYYSYRSVQVFAIFEEVFGDVSKIVRIVSSQAANSFSAQEILDWQNAKVKVDRLAIAPYFGGHLGDADHPETSGWTVDQIMDACEAHIDGDVADWIADNKVVADARSKRLIAYEGGQHLAGVGARANDAALTALFIACNRSTRMGTAYTKYLNKWKALGGTNLAIFSFMDIYEKSGCWGILEWMDQELMAVPKYAAVKSFNDANPPWWT